MTRKESSYEFGDALKQIWNTLRGLENKVASQVKDELLFEMEERGLLPARSRGQASNPLDYWGKGYVPGDLQIVDFLAEVGARRARLPTEWLDRFLKAAGYSEALRRERMRALYGQDEMPLPHHPFNLPARRGDFLGRQTELELVLEALSLGWPVSLIEGMAGIGKTTLALEVAYACARQPRNGAVDFTWPEFPFIVWTSAEGRGLTLDDLLSIIAYRLDHRAVAQKSLEEKRQRVPDLLAQQPVLLIVDNFETITDLGIADFVVRVPSKVKVLLTSREDEKLLAPIFRRYPPARICVGGLPDTEALTFLRQEAGRLVGHRREAEQARLEVVRDSDYATLLPLVRATGGNPKALALALGHIADSAIPLKTLVRDLYAAADSVVGLLDYFFHHAWERCGDDARALWRVIPLFAAPIRREALAATAGLQGRYFYDALEQLRGRSLLDMEKGPAGEPRYYAHPLARTFATARLRDLPDFGGQAQEQWVEWYTEFLAQHNAEDWPVFEILDQERENLLAVITWALTNCHPLAPAMVRHFWSFLYIRGHWRQCETFTRQALDQATSQEDTPMRLWLAAYLGWLLSEQGRYQEALQALHLVEAEILTLGQPTLLEETRVNNFLGQVNLWQDDLEQARAHETRFLALAEQGGNRRNALLARYYLALIELRQGQADEAEQAYRALVTEAQDIGWQRAEGYCAYRLASALIYLGRLEEATHWLDHAGEMANRWQEPLLHAHVLFGRAQLSGKFKQPGQACALARAALDLYHRLEARFEIQKTEDFLADSDGGWSPDLQIG